MKKYLNGQYELLKDHHHGTDDMMLFHFHLSWFDFFPFIPRDFIRLLSFILTYFISIIFNLALVLWIEALFSHSFRKKIRFYVFLLYLCINRKILSLNLFLCTYLIKFKIFLNSCEKIMNLFANLTMKNMFSAAVQDYWKTNNQWSIRDIKTLLLLRIKHLR